VLAGAARREPVVTSVFVVASLAVIVATAVAGGAKIAAPALGLLVILAIGHERLLAWRSLLSLTILIILFVPIKRYTLPGNLSFNLELYRLVVALVFFAWLTSLLIDPRVRLRASGLETPLLAFLFAILLSLVVNTKRVNSVGSDAPKTLTFFASFVLTFYVLVSLVRRARDIDFLVRMLAGGGAVLAGFAIFESVTTVNVFNHLSTVLPILRFDPGQAPSLHRGGRLRVYASAQHPIALGAAFALLLPLAIYRARAFGQRRWWFAAGMLLLGLLATRSRTGILMLLAVIVVYLLLRTAEVKRLWWAVLPALILIHFALPGTLGTIKESFFPRGGLIAQQANPGVGSGRIATLGPALHSEFLPNPILGEGFSTRITKPDSVVPVPNGPILDDEWLGILLETGVVGTAALLWFFARALRLMGSAGKRDLSPRGWLLVGVTASVAGFAISMFTYDAFSFIQATFLLFIVLGIGAAALRSPPGEWQRLAESGR